MQCMSLLPHGKFARRLCDRRGVRAGLEGWRDDPMRHRTRSEAARQIRIQDPKLVHHAGAGHIGGDF